jgi:hypothetical protein
MKRIYGLLSPKLGKFQSCLFTVVSIGAVFGFASVNEENFVFKVYLTRIARFPPLFFMETMS